jgi:hypothetical protein
MSPAWRDTDEQGTEISVLVRRQSGQGTDAATMVLEAMAGDLSSKWADGGNNRGVPLPSRAEMPS